MTLYVAIHTHEYGQDAYLFYYTYKGDQPTPPKDQELANLLLTQGNTIQFHKELDQTLTPVHVANPEHLPPAK